MKKNYLYFCLASLILFLALFLLLCKYFRLSTDDFHFLSEVEQKGIFYPVSYSYFKWSGRFAAFAVLNLLFSLLNDHRTYAFLIPLFTFILLITGMYFHLRRLSEYYTFKPGLLMELVLCFSFIALLFFLSFDIGETWFWCCSIGGYLLNIVAVIWALVFIFHPRNNFFNSCGIIICCVFVGGSCEVYALFFVIFLGIFIYHRYKKGGPDFFRQRWNRQLLLAFVSLTISFIILIAAPGNYVRSEMLPSHQFVFSFITAGKSLVKFFVLYLPKRLLYLIAFLPPFYFAGRMFKQSNEHLFSMGFSRFAKKLTLIFVTVLITFSWLLAYLLSETGPARLWFFISFLFSIYCCLMVFYYGYSFRLSGKAESCLKTGSVLLAISISAYSLVHQYNLASRYSIAFDKRERMLLEFNERTVADTILVTSSLPPAGMLYPAEITGDMNHYKNQHLRAGYKLRFQIVEN